MNTEPFTWLHNYFVDLLNEDEDEEDEKKLQ
jgi:hypothetical protein